MVLRPTTRAAKLHICDSHLGSQAAVRQIRQQYALPAQTTTHCPGIATGAREFLSIWYASVYHPFQFRKGARDYNVSIRPNPSYELIKVMPRSWYPALRRVELCFEESIYNAGPEFYTFSVELNARTNTYTIKHTPRCS